MFSSRMKTNRVFFSQNSNPAVILKLFGSINVASRSNTSVRMTNVLETFLKSEVVDESPD